ncbi:MAG: hypothetical protein PHO15_03430 [Eubacteriales bacterium]|nr:hypothetical protein [Eubacteriales bacterium]
MSIIKEKLTDKQLRIIQVIAGILCAAALIVSIYIVPLITSSEKNSIFSYLFLVVFLIIMIGRRKIEAKYRLRLNLFGLVLIDGLVVGILIYALLAFGEIDLDENIKILIVVGVVIALLILGVYLPARRYLKRKESGKLIPIRLPEPAEEPEHKEEDTLKDQDPMTIEQQIAAMTKELDNNDGDDK